jgi:hypothetical protein
VVPDDQFPLAAEPHSAARTGIGDNITSITNANIVTRTIFAFILSSFERILSARRPIAAPRHQKEELPTCPGEAQAE